MKPLALAILALTIALPLPATALTRDEARRCAVMARTFEAKTAEIAELKEALSAAAETAEEAGETWENAEAMRNFGDAQAAEADQAQANWQAAKNDFEAKQAALKSAVQMLNRDVSEYNRTCASE